MREMKWLVPSLMLSGMVGISCFQTALAGPYVSLGLDFANDEIGASSSGVNHPTRCDRLLYADPSMAPGDAACTDDTVRTLLSDSFDLGGSFNGAAAFGYAWGSLRIEAEFLSRAHEGDLALFGGAVDNPALQDKATEWSTDNPPHHRVYDFTVRQLFLNLTYDFDSGGNWVPYVGVGAGLARVNSRYRASFLRRTLADGYVDAVGGDPGQPEDWQVAAAGTLSEIDTLVSEDAFGYQVQVGVERGLNEGASFFVALGWTAIDDVASEDVWDTLRSHRPVQADGVTPFTSVQDLRDIGELSATVGLRYEF